MLIRPIVRSTRSSVRISIARVCFSPLGLTKGVIPSMTIINARAERRSRHMDQGTEADVGAGAGAGAGAGEGEGMDLPVLKYWKKSESGSSTRTLSSLLRLFR